jgi:exonuclease III
MRLLAWNIRQGGGARLPQITEALKRHDAEIVVLSEYRGGPSAARLCGALLALGYRHATTLVPPPSRNGVLIATRRPFSEHGAVDMGLPEPYRMVSVDFATFRLIGVYMPNLLAKIPYWEALVDALSSPSAYGALAIGDFNTCRPISTRQGRSTGQRITWTRSSGSGFATCGGTAIPTGENIPGSAPGVTGSGSTMLSCRKISPLAPASSAIPIRSGLLGFPTTRC